jgi:hypothetical protein
MYWNRSAADITAAWQEGIESKLETGATAVLLGGTPSSLTTSAATLLALQNASTERTDVATPLLVAGGNSAAWLGLLLPPQPIGHSSGAPAPTLVYGGVDEATYLAIVGLTVGSIATPGTVKPSIPNELVGQIAPRLQPGAATAWEALPFVEVGEQPIPPLALSSLALTATRSDPTSDWIAWGVMLLAFCLVLSALLI